MLQDRVAKEQGERQGHVTNVVTPGALGALCLVTSSVAACKFLIILPLSVHFVSEMNGTVGHVCEQRTGMYAHVLVPRSHTQHSQLLPGFRDTYLVPALSPAQLLWVLGPL